MWKNVVLDFIFMNLVGYYVNFEVFFLFGLFDYNIVFVVLMIREGCIKVMKFIFKCDLCFSCKVELGCYLSGMD